MGAIDSQEFKVLISSMIQNAERVLSARELLNHVGDDRIDPHADGG